MQRALSRWNGLLLIVALLIAWQLLFEFAGEDAMAPPMATIAICCICWAPLTSGRT